MYSPSHFGCFVQSRCECFHCITMRTAIKACMNLHTMHKIQHTHGKNYFFSPSNTTCIAIYICSNRRSIPKVENFFEVIVPRMAPKHFRRYFRMYEDTLESIISYLALEEPFTSLLNRGRISRHKKVAMTCAYLGSKQTIMQ